MSLTDNDNYWGSIAEVFEVQTHVETIGDTEHEVIFGVVVKYGEGNRVLDVDTKYWRHFVHSDKRGLDKEAEGVSTDDMTKYVEECFAKTVTRMNLTAA